MKLFVLSIHYHVLNALIQFVNFIGMSVKYVLKMIILFQLKNYVSKTVLINAIIAIMKQILYVKKKIIQMIFVKNIFASIMYAIVVLKNVMIVKK